MMRFLLPPALAFGLLTGSATVCLAQTATPTSMQFKLVTDNSVHWISAEGPITKRTPEDFRAFTKQYRDALPEHRPAVTGLVLLDSPGGNLYAGLQLGRLLREGNFATMVGKTVFPEESANGRDGHAAPRQEPAYAPLPVPTPSSAVTENFNANQYAGLSSVLFRATEGQRHFNRR